MKRFLNVKLFVKISILISCTLFYFYGCKEIGPAIDFTPPDTTLIDTSYLDPAILIQKRNVLIEEFTGVQCVNCTEGHEKLKNLIAKNSGRLFAISIHDGFYSVPITGFSKQDFRTKSGTEIVDMLGSPQGFPAACISRVKFNGEVVRYVFLNKWENYSDTLLKENSEVSMVLSSLFDSSDRSFKINIKLHYAKATTDTQAISVVIIENKIIDAQQTDVKIDTAYEHNLVFRSIMTPATGFEIIYPKEVGRVVIKEFKINLKNVWKEENCEALAFVHKIGSKLDVLQVMMIRVMQ